MVVYGSGTNTPAYVDYTAFIELNDPDIWDIYKQDVIKQMPLLADKIT